MLEDAKAYRAQVIANAEGEASRFTQLLTEYRKAPEVTRQRMYLTAVESVLSNSSKVMVDVDKGSNMLFLPLDRILEQRGSSRSQGSASPERKSGSSAGSGSFAPRLREGR